MKPVTMYEANDGSRWDTEAAALQRNALLVQCEAITKQAGMFDRPKLPGCEFENGGGFVQQPPGTRHFLLVNLRKLGANRDSDGPIGLLMYRMHCIDDEDREWGQPYFAINHWTGKQVCLGGAR